MGKSSRTKGARAQTAAKNLLTERDWRVTTTSSGASQEDIIATDTQGRTWSVEVKDQKTTPWEKFRTQARDQAKRSALPWMLMVHVPGTRHWVIERQGEGLAVWNERNKEGGAA